MAERRMFAKTITESDAFLDMPLSTQALYFHLGMLADDDGFVNGPKKIMRMIGASADDMNILIGKKFVVSFDSGVIVVKHWKINNLIKNDRYKPTKYKEEMLSLRLDDNNAYTTRSDGRAISWNQNGSKVEPQDRLGKDRLGKDRLYKGDQIPTYDDSSNPILDEERLAELIKRRS